MKLKNPMLKIPGPRGPKLLSFGKLIQTKPLEAVLFGQKHYGDLFYCPWPLRHVLFVYHPESIRYVLKDNHQNYQKSSEYKNLKPLLGNGLLTSEGELWRQERKLMAKEFHPARIDHYVTSIKNKTNSWIENLKKEKIIDESFDISSHLAKLTFTIAGEIFFGASVEAFSESTQLCLTAETHRINKRMRRIANFPDFIPTKENREGKKSIGELKNVVSNIMDNPNHESKNNILSKLMTNLNDPKLKLDKKLIQDEVMTLLLAGHETTSTALMWTMYLLAKNPDWQDKLFDELKHHKNAGDLLQKDLTELPLLKSVILESLRLYPPIPMISRSSIEEDQISGYFIEKKTNITLQVFGIHRDGRFWENPLQFIPDRFLNPLEEKKRDLYFFPFAKGPRTCIGETLALVEAQLILSHIIQNFQWELESNFEPVMSHNLTLQSSNGLRVKLKKRHSETVYRLHECEDHNPLP